MLAAVDVEVVVGFEAVAVGLEVPAGDLGAEATGLDVVVGTLSDVGLLVTG